MRMTLKAERILSELFEAFLGEPRLLPDEQYELTLKLPTTDQARVITDYIAGMTDRYALSEHQKLFSPPVPTV